MYKTFFLFHGKSPSHIKRLKTLHPSHKLVWFCWQQDSCITACPDPIRHYHWLVGSDLWKEHTCQSSSLHYSYLPLPRAFYPVLWISASQRLLIAGLHPQSPHHFAISAKVPQNVPSSYLSHNYYISRQIQAPPLLWLQKHTDISTHNFTHSPDLWHQPGLANVTRCCSWRLCEINPTKPISYHDY